MNWSERYAAVNKINFTYKYAIANAEEFSSAMNIHSPSNPNDFNGNAAMEHTLINHYTKMYAFHNNAITQLGIGAMRTFDPQKATIMHEGIEKHQKCQKMIGDIISNHQNGKETGDSEDYYNTLANDAFDHSNGVLNK